MVSSLIKKIYLQNLLKHFKNFIKKLISKQIPLVISENEILVRGIVSPFFVSSKRRLKREAFLPRNSTSGVSLLRLYYTTEDFCKNHSANLVFPNNEYRGLGTINIKMVRKLNKNSDLSETAYVKATPLDISLSYEKNKPVFKKDRGLPMHADLFYEGQEFQTGTVQTKYRQYSNELAKLASYFEDPSPKSPGWRGESLKCAI